MNLPPVIRQRYFDSNGNPLAGGKLYCYQAGTSTPQASYTDSGGGTANANPVILDANGEANVWLDPTLSYKFVLKDSSDVIQWTTDNVIGLLTANAVNTAALQDSSVTTIKIADSAVTGAKIQSDASVDGNRPVNTNHIRDSAITRAKLATGAVAKVTAANSGTTSPYTATASDDVILVPGGASTLAGAFTVNLPAAATNSGKVITIKKTDSSTNVVTVDGSASETIDGSLTFPLSVRYEAVSVMCDGSNWFII